LNTFFISIFNTISSDKAVLNSLNLLSGFILAIHLKDVLSVDPEIPVFDMFHGMKMENLISEKVSLRVPKSVFFGVKANWKLVFSN
jgi:hypothetical protein